jgi:hypothetical protein
MAELNQAPTTDCCTVGAQQTCCEPGDKESCCGESDAGDCGCSAGTGRPSERPRPSEVRPGRP